jgi:hypothetical protein
MIIFQGYSPEKDTMGVSRTTPIYFEIRNETSTANRNTINVKIDGIDAIINGVFQTNFSGAINNNARGYDVYVQHTVIFTRGQTIAVLISVDDNAFQQYTDSYSFTIIVNDTISPVVIANPKGSTYNSQQSVSLISSKPNTTIYYTVDGSYPTNASTQYTVPIVILQNTTLKFFGIDEDDNSDIVHVELYSFDTYVNDNVTPVTTASVGGGNYNEEKFVTLTSSKPATIYYTLDGSTPTINYYTDKDASPVVLAIIDNIVLKYFAVDEFGNQEIVKTQSYTIYPLENNIVPTNVFVSFPYIKYTADICWDDMMQMRDDVVGYNIYRSQTDEQSLQNIVSHDVLTSNDVYSKSDKTFVKINKTLVTTTFYRDQKLNTIVVKENVSDQFRVSTPVEASTDFTGEIVNANQWEAIDDDRLFSQSNGINFIDVYGYKDCYFQSKFILKNDFDIETQYELVEWPITDSINFSEMSFIVSYSEFSYVKLSKVRREATDYYVSSLVVDSQEVSRVEVLNSDMKAKIRIIRSTTDVSTYYNDGSTWVLLDSYLNFSKDNLQVKFYNKSPNTSVNVKFLYFNVNVGKAYLPLIKNERNEYWFDVRHAPIVTNRTNRLYTDQTFDVDVIVDGKSAIVKSVDGLKGRVVLQIDRQYDEVRKLWVEPVVPTISSIVTVSYMYEINTLKMNLSSFPYYKVTAILEDGSETRLEWCPAETLSAEKLDYMYLEAIRRNNWLLDNAGERVLLFIRKTTGTKCECYKRNERTHVQPQVGSCKLCWGTGFVGGYEGPFEIRISPFQSEQKIRMTERGMKLENMEKTWTTISPTITQRDFIIRRKAQVYAIGPISTPDVKGIATQQHFDVEYVDSTDIRYEFVTSLNLFNYKHNIGLRKSHAHYTEDPIIVDGEIVENDRLRTDKGPGRNDEKGRALNFENSLF